MKTSSLALPSAIIAFGILALGVAAVFGSGAPIPKITVKAQSPKAKALAATQGAAMALVVVVPKSTNYMPMAFEMPNDGSNGYWNRPVTVQVTMDFKTWKNVAILPAGTTTFYCACTNARGFFRLVTPSWK